MLLSLRDASTMNSDEAFRAGNRAAGPLLTLGGLLAIASGAVAMLIPHREASGMPLVGGLAMGTLVIVGAVRASRLINR